MDALRMQRQSDMADINRRIERIERLIGGAACICAKNRTALLIIDDDSIEEQKTRAESSMSFVCPTHGLQLPRSLILISGVDASL
jgi:hypothetical protein